MAVAPFPVDPALTAIAIAYGNRAYIADAVLPRVPVGKPVFKYLEYPLEEGFNIPDTKVGRRGRPNVVEYSAEDRESATQDFGLDGEIPMSDIEAAPANYRPVDRAVEGITDSIALDRELRTAGMVFNAAAYPTGNKVTLSGSSQFSDYAGSDPLGVILNAMDACLLRPNVMVLGEAVWTKLRQHPRIVKAVHGNSGDSGVATREQVASLFEVEEILVGRSLLNTARKGQTAALARVWGKHVSLIHRNRQADTSGGVTFGFTAEWGGRVAGQWEDKDIGLRGGLRVRVGESVRELVVAPRAGYFIENAIA